MFNLNKFIADSVTFRPVSMKYMINGWEDLICYREDGNYDIDNLASERAIGRLLYTERMPYPSEVRMGLRKRVCSSHCVRHASNTV